MRAYILLAPALLLTGCATAADTELSSAGTGSIPQAVECVAAELQEDGFTITSRDDAGIVNAERGESTVTATVVPGDLDRYSVRVETDGSDASQEVAADVVEACGTG